MSVLYTHTESSKQEGHDELLAILEKSAKDDPEFGKPETAKTWSVEEVCHWLISLGMENYIFQFYNNTIDASTLFSTSFDQKLLVNNLKVKQTHAVKIMQELQGLKTVCECCESAV